MTTALSPVLRAIDCIEEHLRAPFQVADAAAAAGYSIFHFSRTFSQVTRQSPYEYLMRRRLSLAAHRLLESDRRVLDVALDFQFDTPEGFSRAFKKMFGQQPQQFRKQQCVDPRLLMPRLSQDYLKYLPSIPLAPLQESLKPVKLVGLMALSDGKPQCIPELLERVAIEIHPHLPDRKMINAYTLTLYLKDWERRGCACFVGVPAGVLARTPAAFAAKSLPPGKYASFHYKGADTAVNHTLAYIYHTWMPHAGFSPLIPLTARRFQWDPLTGQISHTAVLVVLNTYSA